MIAARFVVSGHVQGVAFRAYTRAQAMALSLRGYAINLHDGRVEVMVAGESDAVDRLGEWLWQGSPASRVEQVTRVSADPSQAGDGFRIG